MSKKAPKISNADSDRAPWAATATGLASRLATGTAPSRRQVSRSVPSIGGGAVIDEMHRKPVDALVGQHQAQRPEGALQRVPDGFRAPGRVDRAPAGADDQVLPEQHQRAGGRRGRTAPLVDGALDHLGRYRPRQRQIACAVLDAQPPRIDAEEVLQIMVAHVLEIP